MKVLMVRANQGQPDSRVEKEIYSLSKEHTVELLGWDRTKNKKSIEERTVFINNKEFHYHLICQSAPQGGGFKKTLIPMLKFWYRISYYLKKYQYKYDVIHFCDFDTAAMAFSVVDKNKVKVVYDIFDYYADAHSAPALISKLIRKRENYIINKSNMVILCSEARKQQISPAYNKTTIIIHNSPSKDTLPKEVHIQGGKNSRIRLVYVGMLSYGRYLKKMANIIKQHPEFEWHVGGFGELESYFKNLAKTYSNIFFYGKLQYPEVLFLESQCDIMTAIYDPAVSNHKYAAPNKFYESLILGKPVIMVKGTGMADIVKKYDIGNVIDLDNNSFENGFLNGLRRLSKTKKSLIEKHEKELYKEEFSWDIMEKRLLGGYRCLSR